MIAFFRKLFLKPKHKTTWIYCYKCRHEMNDGKSRCEYEACRYSPQIVAYWCEQCGTKSRFDFDMPAPGRVPSDDGFEAWEEWQADQVDQWHLRSNCRSIHERLGMSEAGYQVYLHDPRAYFERFVAGFD